MDNAPTTPSANRVFSLPPSGTGLPPQVAALGPAQSVHKPNIPATDPGDKNIPTYMVFADAIVAAQPDQSFVILRWDEFVETDRTNSFFEAMFSASLRASLFNLKTADGYVLRVLSDVTEVKALEQTIIERTNAVLVPKAMTTIERGEVAKFGHLGLSREAFHVSDYVYPWQTVKSLEVVYWRGIQLCRMCSSGWLFGLWPACNAELYRLPNGAAFEETLRQVAPSHLLRQE